MNGMTACFMTKGKRRLNALAYIAEERIPRAGVAGGDITSVPEN